MIKNSIFININRKQQKKVQRTQTPKYSKGQSVWIFYEWLIFIIPITCNIIFTCSRPVLTKETRIRAVFCLFLFIHRFAWNWPCYVAPETLALCVHINSRWLFNTARAALTHCLSFTENHNYSMPTVVCVRAAALVAIGISLIIYYSLQFALMFGNKHFYWIMNSYFRTLRDFVWCVVCVCDRVAKIAGAHVVQLWLVLHARHASILVSVGIDCKQYHTRVFFSSSVCPRWKMHMFFSQKWKETLWIFAPILIS